MKKTALLITLLLVALATAYLLFDKYYEKEPATLWDLVPANAITVYESSQLYDTWGRLHESVMWPSLVSIPAIDELERNLSTIDTLNGEPGGVKQLMAGNFLISIHVVKKNAFDFLYLVDLNRIETQQLISSLIRRYENDNTASLRTRTYQEMEIHEIEKDDWIFSYFIHDNKLIASFTPFLVEDVIRRITDPEMPGFAAENPGLLSMPKLSSDDGNLYLNIDNLGEMIAAFAAPENVQDAREISNLGNNAFLDIKAGNNNIFLSGFTSSGNDRKLLSAFKDQVPVEVDFKFRVPVNTAVFYHFSFSDISSWHDRMETFWGVGNSAFLDERRQIFETYNLDIDAFYAAMGGSISLMQLEIPGSSGFTPVAMATTRDPGGMMSTLNQLGESIARAAGDTAYVENYGVYEIRELEIDEFPRELFGPLFTGFERTYFSFDGEVLYLAPDLVTLKEVLSAIQSENTWGRSVLYNRFVDDLLKEANITMVVNTRKAWENILSKADPVWLGFARENASSLKNFGLVGIQFSKMDELFYTSIMILHDGRRVEQERRPRADVRMRASLTYPISTKPYVVRNHTNNLLEVAVQDTADYFHLIGPEGNVLWSKRIDGPMTSDVTQVDFYNNGKLQYFFTTAKAIHIIDRLGNYVEGFPVALDHNARYATVVDYDNSKNYRWLISDEFGNLFLYNKNGVVLEGWSPRAIGGRLSSAPFHVRVRGRDCIIAIEAAGRIHMTNRRGEYYKGFPLDLGARIETLPYIQPGANFSETELTVIDRDGKLITFNMDGKVIRSEQLYKPTTSTVFELIPDVLGKTYIIARYDKNRLVLLNREQNEIMAKDYLDGNQLNVQYYDFGSDVQVYAVADETQGFTYLYDNDGSMIGAQPLDSGREIALLYSELNKTFTIYYVSGKQVLVQSF